MKKIKRLTFNQIEKLPQEEKTWQKELQKADDIIIGFFGIESWERTLAEKNKEVEEDLIRRKANRDVFRSKLAECKTTTEIQMLLREARYVY